MPRSLAANKLGKELIEAALKAKHWTAEDLSLYFDGNSEMSVARSTSYNFCNGLNVRPEKFQAMCDVLKLDWEVVSGRKGQVVFDPESPPAQNSGGTEPVEQLTRPAFKPTEGEEHQIRQHCRKKILTNYSKIRLLSGQEISVDQLYVDVWLLDREPRTFQVSQDNMLRTFDLRNDRLGLGDRIVRNPGFEVANKQSKLLILGKPGSGKSTFLKHLAVDWCNGEFQRRFIAVFIEFRSVISYEWDLKEVIRREMNIKKNVDDVDDQLTKLLKEGRLLIFMDGLDEVSTINLRKKVQNQISMFVKEYPKNHYVVACRTQILQVGLDGFTSVEVAEFDQTQVRQFVRNWFYANGQDKISVDLKWKVFLKSISYNLALKELTVTPVVLSLICLILQDEGEMPSELSLLYARGIKLLLSKWNDNKEIDEWEIGVDLYRKLTIEQKENLLVEIAAQKIQNPKSSILFKQDDLIRLVKGHLRIDATGEALAILKSIESQHGLIIERADELWSFSHLTFQEHFITKWLLSMPAEELSRKIGNKLWQEDIQRLVKAQGQSNYLIKLIKRAIDCFIHDDKKCQNYLTWISRKINSINETSNLAAVRLFYFGIALDCEYGTIHNFSYGFSLNRNLAIDLSFSRDLAQTKSPEFGVDVLGRSKFGPQKLELNSDFALDLIQDSDQNTDSELADKLAQLKVKLSTVGEESDFESWWKLNGKIWRDELRQAMIKHRDIGHDWQFNNGQMQNLKSYFDTNKFLVELLKIENAVSPEVRQEIEDNLLLPIAELKRRLPDQYGGIEEG